MAITKGISFVTSPILAANYLTFRNVQKRRLTRERLQNETDGRRRIHTLLDPPGTEM